MSDYERLSTETPSPVGSFDFLAASHDPDGSVEVAWCGRGLEGLAVVLPDGRKLRVTEETWRTYRGLGLGGKTP